MNPCPCGYYGDPLHKCTCTPGQISRYLSKISGPLLDRIDIHCEIQAVPFAQLSQMQPGEPSSAIRERVIRARNIQTERFSSLSLGEGGGEAASIVTPRWPSGCSTSSQNLMPPASTFFHNIHNIDAIKIQKNPQKFFFKEIKIFQRLFVTFCLYPLQIPNTKNRMQIPENRNLCFYLLHRNTANHQTETCKRTEKDLQNSFLLNILHQ